MAQLPTLYKKTSTGAIQQWTISTHGPEIKVVYGQVDGKMQTAFDVIREGKNLGKKNETNATEQAILEARAQWEKKRKKHYVEDIRDAVDGNVDTSVIAGGVLPMLAQSYSKHAAKINFPAAVQPKLDGHRCIAIVGNDRKVTLWSRTQKPITGVPHINAALESLGLPTGATLDGELYNHDYKNRFEELTSFIKRPEPKSGHEVVQYHVYDQVSDQAFEKRYWNLTDLGVGEMGDPIVRVSTTVVQDESEMMELFEQYTSKGFEGLMVRNVDSPYVNKRSYDLQKVKEFEDAEYEIVGVVSGRGKLEGCGIFVCKTSTGDTFNCKMMGPIEDLKTVYANRKDYVGRMLTVKYQGITNATQVPRFPIGVRVRDDV